MLKGKTVFITGASSGIGKASAERFAALGANLVITARRLDRLKALESTLMDRYGIACRSIELDVRNFDEVQKAFQGLDVDVLLNNAGLALSTNTMQTANVSDWETMIDTNLKGFLYVIKASLPRMIERNQGHIINLGSIAGRSSYMGGNIYCATKHAVRSISESLRIDLSGTALRVSEIAPGAVETEFSEVRWNDKERARKFYQDFEPLVAEDIADAILYVATRPSHVNISELVVYPQAQASPTTICRGVDKGKDPFALPK